MAEKESIKKEPEQKVCLITGANAGIGKAAAIQLAVKGLHVFIACRNITRGKQALAEIKDQSKSESVDLIKMDLSSRDSIHSAVEEFTGRIQKIDMLIHNAADFDISRKQAEYSPEGIEIIWATNHLGPVFLTNLLLPNIKKSEQGRIIMVASQGLVMHPNLKVNLEDPEFREGSYSPGKAYYQSKLAQVMYTYWLAEQLKVSNITANCIRVTNVKVDLKRYPNVSGFMKFLYSIKSKFSISPEDMAKTYTYLATSRELDDVSGKYFNEKNQIVSSSKYSLQKQNIKAVMELTQKYIDINLNN